MSLIINLLTINLNNKTYSLNKNNKSKNPISLINKANIK